MRLKSIELTGFKSFAKKTLLEFGSSIVAVVGPNGSGKSNVAESFRFVLGEQSMKSMRGKRGEDLIWNGSNASPRAGRAGVKLVFDNADRALNLDFDEVSIERTVHRDGGNDYSLNGSLVRLRDIAELLSQANIGSTGHHIISQGEADRVLSASSRERREMIEDALGLTAYLYKREEAEHKLERTAENSAKVEAVRRELLPHLKFLAAQVKKIEDAKLLRNELAQKYLEYFKRESVYLATTEAELSAASVGPENEHKQLAATIEHLRADLQKSHGQDSETKELMSLEEEARGASHRRDDISRELGRIEGELAARAALAQEEGMMPAREAREFGESLLKGLEEAFTLSDVEGLKQKISHALALAKSFLQKLSHSRQGSSTADLEAKKTALERELVALRESEARITRDVSALRQRIESQKDESRASERELFAAMARRSELESALNTLRAKATLLEREAAAFKRDLGEAAALVGSEVADYAEYRIDDATDTEIADEDRGAQEERRRKIERQKIRLEESGAAGAGDILQEHRETTERDAFLARELADLETSAKSLKLLIDDLTHTLEERFTEGVTKINKEFDAFFKLMFGGGTASLAIVREKKIKRGMSDDEVDDNEDIEVEEGIEITIALPHKRIKGLHMLSGGERALTSIALIFAMSQVNPPPFLILDETDAALDEANSRRYGDMIETLAKRSQLILITHNRETMSRAGVLYGVTMGTDGVSKLLSVKFEEAVAVAK